MYDDLPPPARAGIRAIAPLIVAAFPFGLVYGVAVTRTDIDPWLGAAASVLILAGAAQLSLLELLDATWAVAVGTSDRGGVITVSPLPPRRLGLVEIQRSRVTLAFHGLDAGERDGFLRQFDRAFQRGGG